MSSEEDIEKAVQTNVNTNTTKKESKQFYCNECKIENPKTTIHCEDCKVCIEDYDHHCVFFSKCIGGGNIVPFWGSMGLLMVNFAIIVLILIFSGISERPHFSN